MGASNDATSDDLRGGKPSRSRDLSMPIADMAGPSTSPDLAIASNSAKLTWNAPTQNANGTVLDDLAGYAVYHGLVAPLTKANSDRVDVGNVTSYAFSGLTSGTHYFAVAAYDMTGNESTLSSQATKTIQP